MWALSYGPPSFGRDCRLGLALRRLSGHRAAVLSASEDFESAFAIRPRGRHELWNGPLRCTLIRYEL